MKGKADDKITLQRVSNGWILVFERWNKEEEHWVFLGPGFVFQFPDQVVAEIKEFVGYEDQE